MTCYGSGTEAPLISAYEAKCRACGQTFDTAEFDLTPSGRPLLPQHDVPPGQVLKEIPEDAVAIWSVERGMWWSRDNSSGYTRSDASAGVYTLEEACQAIREGSEKKFEIVPHPYAGTFYYRSR